MGAFLALIWILQVVNWADSYRLDQSFGILPRNVGRLGDIFTAPFLHANWEHIEGNSVPLLVLGVAAAYRGILRFLAATAIIAIVSGLTVWLFQSGNSVTIGRERDHLRLLRLRAGARHRGPQPARPRGRHRGGPRTGGSCRSPCPARRGSAGSGHLGGLIGGILAAWLLRAPQPGGGRGPQLRRLDPRHRLGDCRRAEHRIARCRLARCRPPRAGPRPGPATAAKPAKPPGRQHLRR